MSGKNSAVWAGMSHSRSTAPPEVPASIHTWGPGPSSWPRSHSSPVVSSIGELEYGRIIAQRTQLRASSW